MKRARRIILSPVRWILAETALNLDILGDTAYITRDYILDFKEYTK